MTTTYPAEPARVFTPRPYQVEAEAALYREWAAGSLNRLVVSLATGMGKTVVFTNMIRREFAQGHRVIVLVNRKELLDQTADTIAEIVPDAVVGIVQGSRRQTDCDVIVASIQTLSRDLIRLADVGTVDLIIIDECHHAAANSYVDTVRELGGFAGVRVAGFTASAARNDGLGLGDMWQKVVYCRDVIYALAHGYLVPPEVIPAYRGGINLHPDHLAAMWERHAGMQLGMVITDTVQNAYAIQAAFRARGIPAEVVEGEMPSSVRKEIYRRTRAGQNRALISVSCLTEGFDMPCLTFLLMARSVGSQVVWTQAAGRVLRLFPGKTRATIYDATGASAKWSTRKDPYGLIVRADLSTSAPGKRDVPAAGPASSITYTARHTTMRVLLHKRRVTQVIRVQSVPNPSGKGRPVRQEDVIGTVRRGNHAARERKARLMVRHDQARLSGLFADPWTTTSSAPAFTLADDLRRVGRWLSSRW